MLRKFFKQRRGTALVIALVATAAFAAPSTSAAANKKPIVWGASMPMTGVFAFAGIQGNNGLVDYVAWLNSHGGINGHPVKYVVQDTGYKVPRSVAAFKSITGKYSPTPPVYLGDSTGFEKAINKELNAMGTTVMSGASFATDLADPKTHPFQFIAGPTYSQQIYILLEYIHRQAKNGKTPTVAFVHSTTEFGKDPIANALARAKKLGIKVVANLSTKPGSVDVSGDVLKLRRANPDYVIFHGYVLAPINEFMKQMHQLGMHAQVMGTYYSSSNLLIKKMGKDANGYMGVVQYNYLQGNAKGPLLKAIRAEAKKNNRPESLFYEQTWFTGMVFTKIIKDTLDAGKPLTAKNMMHALRSIKDWDTGGIIGVPVTVKNDSFPVGRIYQVKDGHFVPVSDWIQLK